MTRLIRAVGLVFGSVLGYQIADLIVREVLGGAGDQTARLGGLALGIVVGAIVGWGVAPWLQARFVNTMFWVLHHLGGVPLRDVLAGAAGLILGLVIAFLVSIPLLRVPIIGPYIIPLTAVVVFGYLGLQLGIQRREDFLGAFPRLSERLGGRGSRIRRSSVPKLLDTSVIIDGRISDITQSGFLEGPLLVPRSVLAELQRIADASDQIRRNRGRRGLDILNKMQKDLHAVQIYDEGDDLASGQVDAQLVRVARALGAWIVTNDYNLNKIAELQGVRVLNVNELANAIKPVMIPGEELTVHVIKDGKEAGQGVGYLDDGTMIVVEGGKKHIGETLETVVTSVLQTVAGRMIFARPKVLEKDGATR
ncbi:MAG TPA: PIN domain-containing protein [bacterium]|nr:PIN domain-containing protein [bacterium]